MAEGPSTRSLRASEEQLRYAAIMDRGMSIGLIILLVTYLIYVFGIMKPYIPLDQVSQYWRHDVGTYLHEANVHAGWGWLSMLGYGDFLNFIGVILLAGVTIVCYLGIVPLLLKNGDKVYALLAIAEVFVLCVAASGLLGSAGH